MSGIRVSNVWALEDKEKYGSGLPMGGNWIAPPPGSYMSFSISRGANKIYSPGSKLFDTVAYGALGGSWNWNFVFDYNYLEPFLIAFEDYTSEDSGSDGIHTSPYIHTFKKANNSRVRSFVVRRLQLNKIAGGPDSSDEYDEFRGCVMKNMKISVQAGSSQISVSMSGFFSNVIHGTSNLNSTDYKAYDGKLAEFACMYIGDSISGKYVANVDSMSISMDNSAGSIYSSCTPFTKQYNEGLTSNSMSVSCYSNDPTVFKQRVFGGGKTNAGGPLAKGLAPVDEICIASYDYIADDGEVPDDIGTALNGSEYYAMFTIKKCVLKGIEWQRGDGAKIMDQLSSTDCREIILTVKSETVEDVRFNKNNYVQVTSILPSASTLSETTNNIQE